MIYIDDFRLCLEKTDAGHFADDTFIMFGSDKLGSIESVVNYELKLVSKWLKLNKLSLNTGKTELIFFRSKQHSLNYDDISIKFNGVKLIPVDYVKYLGMYIDKYLSWNFHILELCKKLSRANGILSKLRHYAPFKTCLQVYYALFYSHLGYGCNIWGLTSEMNQVEILQKKCLRIITFSDFRSHTNQLFLNNKILKVREIIKLQHLKLVYEFLNNSLPDDLKTLFKLNSDIHNHQLRHLINIPRIATSTYGNKSIKFHCANLWNSTFSNGISIGNDVDNVRLSQIHNVQQFKHNKEALFL